MLQHSSGDTGSGEGASNAAVCGRYGGGIMGTLNGLLEKAEGQLDAVSKAEIPCQEQRRCVETQLV